jgi:hypothetical protein
MILPFIAAAAGGKNSRGGYHAISAALGVGVSRALCNPNAAFTDPRKVVSDWRYVLRFDDVPAVAQCVGCRERIKRLKEEYGQ